MTPTVKVSLVGPFYKETEEAPLSPQGLFTQSFRFKLQLFYDTTSLTLWTGVEGSRRVSFYIVLHNTDRYHYQTWLPCLVPGDDAGEHVPDPEGEAAPLHGLPVPDALLSHARAHLRPHAAETAAVVHEIKVMHTNGKLRQ